MSTKLAILAEPPAPAATRTHCPYCAFQCGMVLGADLSIAADAEFPVNRGQMCIKGFNAHELLGHEDRLLKPRKRQGDRLVEIEWDQTLDEIAAKITALQKQHGPDAMAVFGSGALTNEKAYLLGKFARVALRTANIDYNGRYCMSSAAVGQNRAFGVDRGLPFPVADIARTGCAMLWGTNLADTLPPIMQYFAAMRSAGGKMIVVDPRQTETARDADLHLQLTPGSDLLLASGLLHVAIDEDVVDHDYIAARTRGWEAVHAIALRHHVAYVERRTGVSYAQMRQAVRWLADTPSMLLSGRGPEQQSKGADTVSALANLMLALGKVGKPLSGYGTLTGQGNGQGGREHGQKADQLPGYRSIENPRHRREMASFWGVDEADLPRKGKSAVELLNACGGEIRGLLVMGSNVAVATPDANAVRNRLAKLDLLVVCDSFQNETTEHAHYVLPTLQWAEEDGTLTNLEGRVIRRRRATDAPGQARGDISVLCDLAGRLGCGGKFTYRTSEDVFNELRRATAGSTADYSGISYGRIDREDGVFWPCPDKDHPGTPRLFADRFHHADGRARFVPVDHRPGGEKPDDAYPLYFTTGRYREHYNSGAQTRRVSALSRARPQPKVQLHPRLARDLRIEDGDALVVESRRGRVTFIADVTSEIRPDTLFAPFHWGGGQAANVLTHPALDPASRMPEFKLCAVRAFKPQEYHHG